MPAAARRARSAQAKEDRAQAFLAAALDLATEDGVRGVTLTAVTSRVGLHPSALRRYYDSTEELLLTLAERGWEDWRRELLGLLAGRTGLGPAEAGAALAQSLTRHPVFCDLLLHTVLSLEGAVRLERARAYKSAADAAYEEMVAALVGAVEGLSRPGAETVLATAMGVAGHLYQLSRPSPTLRLLYEQEPKWAHSALRFAEQLREVLVTAVRGAVVRDAR
ncbi:TetR family transcriptional regulator [Phycicoccus endophyticus]|uniref:TetR family transcriptional regulator n=1 Tax=Phycicoccus endophyticus TaxID=1690220 RepID=A0A7G9R1S2_9MICO|nr:TetR family transcriptional regulator [Phycicoccus endophyticus]NHI18655.1 TetR/AcrR family transcriptional regulator [Phycicoccus endophyticus]QNN49547.1 TetR family transcriptional regulator [Phycicoccus endophyticus]GGL37464.1 TetR family transcriptional regulator [Phycicoccus endophyticus]